MNKKLMPAESYLHLDEDRAQITPKIPVSLWADMKKAAVKLSRSDRKVSMNSLAESAFRWYLDALRTEGLL